MQLPFELSAEIERLTHQIPLADLIRSSQELSQHYLARKENREISSLNSDRQRLAYLHVRLPATYAALIHVLRSALHRLPSLELSSMGDVGAGPGTGLWAVKEMIPSIQQVTCYERDPSFIGLGEKLAAQIPHPAIKWVHVDFSQVERFDPQDLMVASYSLGEVADRERVPIVTRLWEATKKLLIIIEPGTPLGFEGMRSMRQQLIQSGAHLIAPCPHAQQCPIESPDWCHFFARIERSSFHRQIKAGTLNFEDEKFSYLVVAREAALPIQGRILCHPQKKSGFVSLRVCQNTGIQQISVSRKSKDNYRKLRKAQWGDLF